MSKRFLSDRDFVKEYEKATNIPDILLITTMFYFHISLPILIAILVVSKLQFPFFPDAYKGMIDWLLLLISIAAVLIILSSVIYTMIIIIGFPTKKYIEEYINYFKQYKAAKKRKKTFLTDIGMSMKEAKRRYKFIMEEAIFVQSLQKICKLNPQTRSGQVEMIKSWYKFKDTALVEYLLDNEYNESDFNMYVGHFEIKNFSEKKSFAELLFKLAILEDGIHNDEWEVLMKLLVDLNFDEIHIDFFKNRYGPLRTESEYSSNNESTSTVEKNVNLLKPYYDLLGLDVGASDEEIKKAYHNLALQHHPDMKKNAGRTKECEEMMAKINEAVEKIRN